MSELLKGIERNQEALFALMFMGCMLAICISLSVAIIGMASCECADENTPHERAEKGVH